MGTLEVKIISISHGVDSDSGAVNAPNQNGI